MDISKESVYWVFRIMIISIAIVIIIMIVGSIADYDIDTKGIKSKILRNKLMLDKNCLAYSDYRVHLGTIDKSKFSKLHLQNCISREFGVKLSLTYEKFSEEILVNDDLADKIDFCYDEKTFFCERKKYNIILNDNSKEIPAKLTMDVISLK